MTGAESAQPTVRVEVENVGGIDRTAIDLSPGVSVLSGRNATNRTSFLKAIMTVLGSDATPLKGDADEGRVALTIGDDTHTRTLRRQNGSIVTEGDPYLDDPELADLFAFLLESNPTRRAIARGDDLRDLLLRPIDTEAIRDEIDDLESEKRTVEAEIDDIESLEAELPDLERRRAELERRIEAKRDDLAETEAELDATDAELDGTNETEAELEAKLEELREARSDLEDVRHRIETERESIAALREERDGLERELEASPDVSDDRIDALDDRIERLRDRRRSIESTLSQLQNVVSFNEELLDGDPPAFVDDLRDDGDGAVTDRLLETAEVTCWTCGSSVERRGIAETVDRLRDLRREQRERRNEITAKLDERKDERDELAETRRQREDTRRRLEEVTDEIDDREETVEGLESDRDRLGTEIEELESTVSELESVEEARLLDLHREANRLEFELGTLRSDLEAVDEEITSIERRIDERTRLEERRAELDENLTELRTQIERIEDRAVEEFNEHMQVVLELLEYENIDRIWLERTRNRVREGREKVTKSTFDLHVVRSTDEGTAYEDTVDHLSESEREVTGLVFALAGYLVHDVHENVPFVLLDSLEALDSERIGRLVDYLGERVENLVVALLPEDATAVDEQYERVTEI